MLLAITSTSDQMVGSKSVSGIQTLVIQSSTERLCTIKMTLLILSEARMDHKLRLRKGGSGSDHKKKTRISG